MSKTWEHKVTRHNLDGLSDGHWVSVSEDDDDQDWELVAVLREEGEAILFWKREVR